MADDGQDQRPTPHRSLHTGACEANNSQVLNRSAALCQRHSTLALCACEVYSEYPQVFQTPTSLTSRFW